MNEQFDPQRLDPEALAQVPVVTAAHDFLLRAARDRELLDVWHLADRTLRTCWAQHWSHANQAELARAGFGPEKVAAVLAVEKPDHVLWEDFARVMTRSLYQSLVASVGADPDQWGIGTAARLVGVDTELLYVHDLSKLPGGVWKPGAATWVFPIVMRLDTGQWRVLNAGAETIPEPGWPPRLGE